MQPQSQEVILKERLESASTILETPLPRLKSKQLKPPPRLQLLQHFSCYYQGKDKKVLTPVQVNCMDYIEELDM